MYCSICHRPHHSKKLPFYCAVDARNLLYDDRIKFAQALIDNEKFEKQVIEALKVGDEVDGTSCVADASSARLEKWKSNHAAAIDRTEAIIAQAEKLKQEIDATKQEIREKKEAMARRRSDLDAVSHGMEARRARQLADTEKSIQRLKYRSKRSADDMAVIRSFLCEEAARLYGLRQIRKNSTRRYEIGGVDIVELHNMHNVAPEVISTSLAHVAHILSLASHYLAVRLPAEVTLPHRDYPKPTIFSLQTSYRHGVVPFPGSFLAPQPTSDTFQRASTPRPLYIEKPLGALAKDDPMSFAYFVEGVSLLAYDISWLCCTQGVAFGDKESFDDICNIGQNLWRLLIGDQVYRKALDPSFALSLLSVHGSPGTDDVPPPAADGSSMPNPHIGRWSHGTAHAFLGSAEGAEFIKSFRLPNPKSIADKLRKRLLNEAPMLEWEQIEGHEALGAEEDLDDGVLVKNRFGGVLAREELGMESIMTVRPGAGQDLGGDAFRPGYGNSPSSKGANRWMKVKGR